MTTKKLSTYGSSLLLSFLIACGSDNNNGSITDDSPVPNNEPITPNNEPITERNVRSILIEHTTHCNSAYYDPISESVNPSFDLNNDDLVNSDDIVYCSRALSNELLLLGAMIPTDVSIQDEESETVKIFNEPLTSAEEAFNYVAAGAHLCTILAFKNIPVSDDIERVFSTLEAITDCITAIVNTAVTNYFDADGMFINTDRS